MKSAEDRILGEISDNMVSQVLKYMDQQETKYDREFKDALARVFLAKVVGKLAYGSLTRSPLHQVSKQDMYDYTLTSFHNYKQDVQEAIAVGIGGAMSRFAGTSVEYYCQIIVVPEPLNTQPC